MWKYGGVETSASPASQWQPDPKPGETQSQHIVRACLEAVEIPGTTEDYHFILQNCYGKLWSNRRTEPWVVEKIERLCWLDLRLIQEHPKTIFLDYSKKDESQGYVFVDAFQRLVYLYEKEGYLQEALAVARIAKRFGQELDDLERIKEKLSALKAEDDN